jgi:macrophage erythroblast attacher
MADLSESKLKHAEHLLLDQPLLRLPNELLRKNFRSAHFTIEKDTSALKAQLKDSATAAVSGRASQEDALKSLDTLLAKMQGTKRKLAAQAEEESRIHDQLDARINHMDDLYSIRTVDDIKYEAWSRRRLDRLLADYLLRRGYNETAKDLAREKGMEKLVDVETFAKMSRIREAIIVGRVTEALAWCTENKKELRKMESKLEFMLRYQQYIDLIRTQSYLEAIKHAQKHLVPYKTTFPKEVQQAGGLLAYRPEVPAPPYAHLFRASRWQEIANIFTETHNNLLGLPSIPLLHVALTSGLSALKTPACHSSESHRNQLSTLGQGVCPICSTELNELARNVPYAHHTQSHIEHNLRLLPNGRAVGKDRLEEQARKSGLPPGQIKDETGQIYPVEVLKRVYIT